MIQLREDTGKQFLDLYETDLPKLTLSIEDITTTDTTTTYSKQFRLPNTPNNDLFFETLFSVNGRDFDVTQKHPATILVNGQEFRSGEIRLQNIYHNKEKNIIEYEIIFLGDVRNLVTAIGEGVLCDLDFSEFAHDLDLATITGSWQAYPETPSSQNEGLFSGSVLYPLVDFGNSYDDDYVAQETRIENGSSNTFCQSSHPLHVDRLRPCIKVKDVWDKIFAQTGYTYTSDFLDSSLFRHLYVGAWGDSVDGLLGAYYGFLEDKFELAYQTETIIPITNANNNEGNFDFANYRFVVPETTTYTITCRVRTETIFTNPAQLGANADYRIKIWRVGDASPLVTETINIEPQQTYFAYYIAKSSIIAELDSYALTAGDEIYYTLEIYNQTDWYYTDVSAEISANGIPLTRMIIAQEYNENVGVALSCNFKQVDFVKDIIDKFRLVVSPDKNNPTNFLIEPWQAYIGTGDVFDWSDKLDISKDVTITPTFNTQKKQITFEDANGGDFLNALNVTNFDEVYGTLKFVSDSPLLEGERKITTAFTPLATTQIEGAEQANNGMDNTIIPQIHDHEVEINSSNNAVLLHNPVVPGVRIFWWNGLKHTGTTSARDRTWYLTDGTITTSYTKFPMISQYNEWGDRDDSWQGIDTLTQDLAWQRERSYIRWDMQDENLGGSVYDYYWSTYLNTLYNKWSRRLTGYFILNSSDLTDFSFDDVIYVNDAYYYVEKIYDVVVGADTPVKVDLIKLNNYYPDTSNFVSPGQKWEDVTGIWQFTFDNWEDV